MESEKVRKEIRKYGALQLQGFFVELPLLGAQIKLSLPIFWLKPLSHSLYPVG
jgi:hypothetical protein